jgi:hypothetical protein
LKLRRIRDGEAAAIECGNELARKIYHKKRGGGNHTVLHLLQQPPPPPPAAALAAGRVVAQTKVQHNITGNVF